MKAISIGAPVLNLKLEKTTSKNAAKVNHMSDEAAEERKTTDPDVDPAMTKYNQYWGLRSSKDIVDFYQSKLDAHMVKGKGGKLRKPRKDTNVGVNLILKPLGDSFYELSPQQQKEFLEDLRQIANNIFAKHGFEIVSEILHVDEQVPHFHVFLFDPDFQVGKKNNLKFKNDLNDLLPREMRKRGWPCPSLTKYDIEKGKKDPEYKEKYRKEREQKPHGLSSKQYKAMKKAEEIKEATDKIIETKDKQIDDLVKEKDALVKEKDALEIEADKSNFYAQELRNAKSDNEALKALLLEERKKEPRIVEKVVEDRTAREEVARLEAENERLKRELEPLRNIYRLQKKGAENEDLSLVEAGEEEYE